MHLCVCVCVYAFPVGFTIFKSRVFISGYMFALTLYIHHIFIIMILRYSCTRAVLKYRTIPMTTVNKVSATRVLYIVMSVERTYSIRKTFVIFQVGVRLLLAFDDWFLKTEIEFVGRKVESWWSKRRKSIDTYHIISA